MKKKQIEQPIDQVPSMYRCPVCGELVASGEEFCKEQPQSETGRVETVESEEVK